MEYPPRRGNNTSLDITGDVVHKLSKATYSIDAAVALAEDVELYTAALQQESLGVPQLHGVDIIPDDEKYRVRIVQERVYGSELVALKGDRLHTATRMILEQLAEMSHDQYGVLQTPVDATAQNFIVSDDIASAFLVDTFPPLLRAGNGEFPFSAIQYSYPRVRRTLVAYTRGTVEGTILQTLCTAALSDTPCAQLMNTVVRPLDWCYEVVPEGLPQSSRTRIFKQIHQRFAPHFLRVAAGDATSMYLLLKGAPRFRS